MPEAETKRKRGRPKNDSPYASAARMVYRESTPRDILNKEAMQRAVSMLGTNKPNNPYIYLHSPSRIRQTILAELGRLDTAEDMRVFADTICKDKVPTGRAVAAIRAYRLGNGTPDADVLERKIRALIDDYVQRYPDTDGRFIGRALDNVRDTFDPV